MNNQQALPRNESAISLHGHVDVQHPADKKVNATIYFKRNQLHGNMF